MSIVKYEKNRSYGFREEKSFENVYRQTTDDIRRAPDTIYTISSPMSSCELKALRALSHSMLKFVPINCCIVIKTVSLYQSHLEMFTDRRWTTDHGRPVRK